MKRNRRMRTKKKYYKIERRMKKKTMGKKEKNEGE